MYIRIRNKSEGVNRLFLEKLGLSTKRDDDSTIGQFGSGSKYAPIYALRNGWEWINCGQDDLGPYQMSYGVRQEGDINSVVFEYGDGTIKESSFTVEAGMLSWDSPFQVFREAFSNCLDGGYDPDIAIAFVDEVDWEPGYFDVYLSAVPELLEIAENIDNYFCVNRRPLTVIDSGYSRSNFDKVFEPITPGTVRVYSKGVLVYTCDKIGMFDYEINDIRLNEERKVASEMDLNSRVASAITSYADDIIARRIVSDINYSRWEWDFPTYYYNGNSKILDAWLNRFDDKAVPVIAEQSEVIPHLKFKGFRAVEVHNKGVLELLGDSGVLTLENALGKGYDFNIIELSRRQEEVFFRATTVINDFGVDTTGIDIEVFSPTPSQHGIWGMCIRGDKPRVLISEKAVEEGLGCLVGTLIHELDHYHSGYGDSDPQFRDIADRRMAELMIQNHKTSYVIEDDVCHIPLSDISHDTSYRIFDCGNFGIVEFDMRQFKIDAPCIADSGELGVNGNQFYFNIKTEGTKAVEI